DEPSLFVISPSSFLRRAMNSFPSSHPSQKSRYAATNLPLALLSSYAALHASMASCFHRLRSFTTADSFSASACFSASVMPSFLLSLPRSEKTSFSSPDASIDFQVARHQTASHLDPYSHSSTPLLASTAFCVYSMASWYRRSSLYVFP